MFSAFEGTIDDEWVRRFDQRAYVKAPVVHGDAGFGTGFAFMGETVVLGAPEVDGGNGVVYTY